MDVIAGFLTGSILSWALPICLLLAIGVYWLTIVRKRSRDEA